MNRPVSIWWCGVRGEFVTNDKCDYHAPEMGCGLRTVEMDEQYLIEAETEVLS